MAFLAAIEVDKRQQIIVAADKMKEMLGGSWTIAETSKVAAEILTACPAVTQIKVASGDIWVRSESLEALEACLWQFRRKIVDHLGLPCSFAIEEENGALDDRAKVLRNLVSEVKATKSGEAGYLSLPWFAPCQIQPSQPANHWIPEWAEHEQHRRRSLICDSSKNRLERGFKTLKQYYHRFKRTTDLKEWTSDNYPNSLNDFASAGDGSYLALLRFDADQSSDFFKKIELKDEHGSSSWKSLEECSKAFGECLDDALKLAFEETIEPLNLKKDTKIPISPLIAEGEDFLIVLRKDLALPFTFHLLKAYSDLTSKSPPLREAVERSHGLASFVFTVSGAIVFARAGFPFSVLSELSGTLEHCAKDHRKRLMKEGGVAQPCLDVYWLESTARENPLVARHSSLTYQYAGESYSLNTRPWTFQETEAMWEAAKALEVPRGKRHQLLAGLWSGEPLASFHYKRWLQHLSGPQLKSMQTATDGLIKAGLWKNDGSLWHKRKLNGIEYASSPLLELHELCEMAGSRADEGSEEGAE